MAELTNTNSSPASEDLILPQRESTSLSSNNTNRESNSLSEENKDGGSEDPSEYGHNEESAESETSENPPEVSIAHHYQRPARLVNGGKRIGGKTKPKDSEDSSDAEDSSDSEGSSWSAHLTFDEGPITDATIEGHIMMLFQSTKAFCDAANLGEMQKTKKGLARAAARANYSSELGEGGQSGGAGGLFTLKETASNPGGGSAPLDYETQGYILRELEDLYFRADRDYLRGLKRVKRFRKRISSRKKKLLKKEEENKANGVEFDRRFSESTNDASRNDASVSATCVTDSEPSDDEAVLTRYNQLELELNRLKAKRDLRALIKKRWACLGDNCDAEGNQFFVGDSGDKTGLYNGIQKACTGPIEDMATTILRIGNPISSSETEGEQEDQNNDTRADEKRKKKKKNRLNRITDENLFVKTRLQMDLPGAPVFEGTLLDQDSDGENSPTTPTCNGLLRGTTSEDEVDKIKSCEELESQKESLQLMFAQVYVDAENLVFDAFRKEIEDMFVISDDKQDNSCSKTANSGDGQALTALKVQIREKILPYFISEAGKFTKFIRRQIIKQEKGQNSETETENSEMELDSEKRFSPEQKEKLEKKIHQHLFSKTTRACYGMMLEKSMYDGVLVTLNCMKKMSMAKAKADVSEGGEKAENKPSVEDKNKFSSLQLVHSGGMYNPEAWFEQLVQHSRKLEEEMKKPYVVVTVNKSSDDFGRYQEPTGAGAASHDDALLFAEDSEEGMRENCCEKGLVVTVNGERFLRDQMVEARRDVLEITLQQTVEAEKAREIHQEIQRLKGDLSETTGKDVLGDMFSDSDIPTVPSVESVESVSESSGEDCPRSEDHRGRTMNEKYNDGNLFRELNADLRGNSSGRKKRKRDKKKDKLAEGNCVYNWYDNLISGSSQLTRWKLGSLFFGIGLLVALMVGGIQPLEKVWVVGRQGVSSQQRGQRSWETTSDEHDLRSDIFPNKQYFDAIFCVIFFTDCELRILIQKDDTGDFGPVFENLFIIKDAPKY